jgi:hypothetical protein
MPGVFAVQHNQKYNANGIREVSKTIKEFENATKVAAEIDFVLFSDGDRAGQDRSETYAGLRSRNVIFKEIGNVVLQAMENKQDVRAAVEAYLAQHKRGSSRSDAIWRQVVSAKFRNTKVPPELMWKTAQMYLRVPTVPGA